MTDLLFVDPAAHGRVTVGTWLEGGCPAVLRRSLAGQMIFETLMIVNCSRRWPRSSASLTNLR